MISRTATKAERLEIHRAKMAGKAARRERMHREMGGAKAETVPNRATVREHRLDAMNRHTVTVRPKRDSLPRNSIWPKAKAAKPGRMG